MRGLGKPALLLAWHCGEEAKHPFQPGHRASLPGTVGRCRSAVAPVAAKNDSVTHPSSATRTLGAWYSTESFTTSTVSSIHLRSPLIFLPLPKAMREPSPRCLQTRLARLTAIRIQEAFTEDEWIGVVQPRVTVLRDVVRTP